MECVRGGEEAEDKRMSLKSCGRSYPEPEKGKARLCGDGVH